MPPGPTADPATNPEVETGYRSDLTAVHTKSFAAATANPLATQAACEVLADGGDIPVHHTASVGVSVVVHGSVDFAVDSETIGLDVGDVLLVNGAGHSWNSEDGRRLLVGMIGAHPRIMGPSGGA